jgi:hypothetical protein
LSVVEDVVGRRVLEQAREVVREVDPPAVGRCAGVAPAVGSGCDRPVDGVGLRGGREVHPGGDRYVDPLPGPGVDVEQDELLAVGVVDELRLADAVVARVLDDGRGPLLDDGSVDGVDDVRGAVAQWVADQGVPDDLFELPLACGFDDQREAQRVGRLRRVGLLEEVRLRVGTSSASARR